MTRSAATASTQRAGSFRAVLRRRSTGCEPAADAAGGLPAADRSARRGTVAAIETAADADGLVLRYDTERNRDGLPPGEGAFLACSFWLADNYILQGRLDEAGRCSSACFASQRRRAARRGIRPGRAQLGNFPQAFSHIALVNSAYNLALEEKPVEKRSGQEAA